MPIDLSWGVPEVPPLGTHLYASGSAWRSPHPLVYSRFLESPQGCSRWVYWCPKTMREGMLFYDGRPQEQRPNKYTWTIGKNPYGDGDWHGFMLEVDAVQSLCHLLVTVLDVEPGPEKDKGKKKK